MIPPENGLEILVVEDDADTRANLADLLALDEHRVATAATGAEALGRPDLARFSAVILDRRLPDGDARNILPTLRARAPNAAVVIVTGYADMEDTIAALRLGAADYILKPLKLEVLRAALFRVAERERLARAKARSEEAFRSLVEAIDCVIAVVRQDRTIAYLSPYGERFIGAPAGRAALDDFIAPRHRREMSDRIAGTFIGSSARGFQVTLACRDGTERELLWNAGFLPDYGGSPAALLVGQDVTGLKQAERLAAIGQMVTGLAHESRNALQRSQACLERLALHSGGDAKSKDLIQRIQAAQDDLTRLYEDVRGYAAPIVLDLGRCDIREVWRHSWASTGGDERHLPRVEFVESCPGDAPLDCSCDRHRLGQVFRNLFENSIAAGASRVKVTVDRPLPESSTLSVRVLDDGSGIPEDRRGRIFEPFFTTKTRGTGLGMPIARRIVEAHGGRLELVDSVGPGTAFQLTIPRGHP